MKEKLFYFWENFDFEMLVETVTTDAWQPYVFNTTVYVIAALVVGLLAYKKTRFLGEKVFFYLAVAFLYGGGGVVLKNSAVNEIGPFLVALTLFFLAIGYVVYTKLIRG